MSTEQMRAEFEAWAIKRGLSLVKYGGGMYVCDNTMWAEIAWIESRAALVVTIEPGDCFSPNDCGDLAIWRDDAKRLLEAAGIPVKP